MLFRTNMCTKFNYSSTRHGCVIWPQPTVICKRNCFRHDVIICPQIFCSWYWIIGHDTMKEEKQWTALPRQDTPAHDPTVFTGWKSKGKKNFESNSNWRKPLHIDCNRTQCVLSHCATFTKKQTNIRQAAQMFVKNQVGSASFASH
jgi:hypothetical protein